MANAAEKKLILLVDDEPVNIKVAHEILKDLYRTRIATSGAKALDAVKTSPPPDLILLDVLMPEMDGYEVCAALKADPVTREIPVIFLTALTAVEDETRGFAVGGVDYIHKPFSPPVVLARVRTHIELREARSQLMETVLATFAPPQAAGVFHPEEAAPLVARLHSLLVANDGDAAGVVPQLAAALAGAVDPQLLAALSDSVDQYDFGGALSALRKIAAKCDLSLREF